MTYGENVGVIRKELAALLRQHRIQQRLGGEHPHLHGEPTSPEERAAMGRIIRRYRDATLVWCQQALEAVGPKNDISRMRQSDRSPMEDLRHRLNRSLRGIDDSGRSLLDVLSLEHNYELMTRWQQVARAAALGEHDFAWNVNRGRLTQAQAVTVAKDAADVIRGLVVLDRRYDLIPGWEHIPWSRPLNEAADRISLSISEAAQDLSVEQLGWTPPPTWSSGSTAPGVAGAVEAQQALLVHLTHLPSAPNLRRVLLAQAHVSTEAARHAEIAAPELVPPFTERAVVYRQLVAQSRNLGGLAGDGGLAAAESHNAVSRLRSAPPGVASDPAPLIELRALFSATDARLATTIEQGLDQRMYFVAVPVLRLSDQQVHGIYQPRTQWAPNSTRLPSGLLPLVRSQLRPAPLTPRHPQEPTPLRREYEAAITHRPAGRSGPRL